MASDTKRKEFDLGPAKIEDGRLIEAGTYQAKIHRVFGTESTFRDKETGEEKTVQYANLEVNVVDDDGNVLAVLEAGYPNRITAGTALGRLVKRFGVNPKNVGEEIDLVDLLEGEHVMVTVVDEETENGVFSAIDRENVNPPPK